jgi:hypothetical protein
VNDALPNRLKVTAGSSLALSCILLTTPFVFSNMAAVGTATFANWCLFIATSYFALLPLPKWGTFSAVHLWRLKVWLLVFLAFAIASWTALALVTE